MTSTVDLVTRSANDLTTPTGDKTFRQMTGWERLIYVKKVVTVEPIVAAYVMAALIAKPALLVLQFEKACRANLAFNDTICDTILNSEVLVYPAENDAIQECIGNMYSWQFPIQSAMPLILVLFLGSYSDRHQLRKPFLILPLIGELFSVVGCILSVVFMKAWPVEVLGTAQTIIPSFFGGQTMLVMAVFAYIADVSTVEMRTLRLGIVQIVLNACAPIVQSFSAVLFLAIGYTGILLIAGCLFVFAILYGLFFIEEPKRPIKSSGKSLLADIFDTRHAVDTFKLLLKKNPGNDRVFIAVLLMTMFIYAIVNVGEDNVFYLYSQGYLHWDIVEYNSFITINTLIHLIGTIIAVPIFTKILKLSDIIIIIVTLSDKILTNVIFGLVKTKTLMYLGAAVSFVTGVTAIGIRSLATKVVLENDLGKAQSLFGITEALGPAIGTPIYSKGIYLSTKNVAPFSFFFFSILLYLCALAVIIWMYFRNKSETKVPANGINGTQANGNGTEVNEKQIPMQDIEITHM